MRNQVLLIKDIVIKEELYPRKHYNKTVVNEYVADMKRGAVFPDIYIAKFKGKLYLVDGRHRIEAYKILGDKHIQCEVKDNFPSFNDIYLASFRANDKHGHRLTREDRMKVALKLAEFKFDIDDISKLTRIQVHTIDNAISGKVQKLVIGEQVKSGKLPKVFIEKVKRREETKVDVVDTPKIKIESKDDVQIYELEQILKYFKQTKLILDVNKISNLIRNIKKVLKKKYPKL